MIRDVIWKLQKPKNRSFSLYRIEEMPKTFQKIKG